MIGRAWLTLEREPALLELPLPFEHRVLRLHLRNAGDDPIEVRRSRIRLLDEHGNDLRAATRPPIVRLVPGAVGHLDLVYRVRSGTGPPAWLEHAGERLPLLTSERRA